jgi:DNA-binding transcriptional LysR family regulator
VALELDELDAIVKFVENGLGVSLIPRAGLWLERDVNLRVIPLGSLTFHREVVLLMRRSQRDLPLHRLFARCLSKTDPADEILCLPRS